MRLVQIITATRYLVLIPIVGLALAAAVLFAFGGVGLVIFLFRNATLVAQGEHLTVVPIFDLLQYVHQFLIGTVLYLTAIGFYQLFIHELPVPGWMKVQTSDDLDTNLVGVIVVVLAIEFLGAVLGGTQTDLLSFGTAIALPIGALAAFLAVSHRVKARDVHSSSARRHVSDLTGQHETDGNQPAQEAAEQKV